MFLCQDFESHVVMLIVHLFSLVLIQVVPQNIPSAASVRGSLLSVIFGVRQLGLERSDRANGRFLSWSICVSTSSSVSVLEHAALFGQLFFF